MKKNTFSRQDAGPEPPLFSRAWVEKLCPFMCPVTIPADVVNKGRPEGHDTTEPTASSSTAASSATPSLDSPPPATIETRP